MCDPGAAGRFSIRNGPRGLTIKVCARPRAAALDLTDTERAHGFAACPTPTSCKLSFGVGFAGFVYERAGNRCEVCYSPQYLNAHHKTYRHHGYEDLNLEDLICLCYECHNLFETKLGRYAGVRD